MIFTFIVTNIELFSLIIILMLGCLSQQLFYSFNVANKTFDFKKFLVTYLFSCFVGVMAMLLIKELYATTDLYNTTIMKILSGTIGLGGYELSKKILFRFLYKTLDSSGIDLEGAETVDQEKDESDRIDKLINHRLFESLLVWSSRNLKLIHAPDIYDDEEKHKREYVVRTILEIEFNLLLKSLKSLTIYFAEIYVKNNNKELDKILKYEYWITFFGKTEKDLNMLAKKRGIPARFLKLYNEYNLAINQSLQSTILDTINNKFYDSKLEIFYSILDTFSSLLRSTLNQNQTIINLNGKLSGILRDWEIPEDFS